MNLKHWQRWKPSESQPWDLRRVVHLHRRTGFAATWSEIQRDLTDGPDASIDRILAGGSRNGVPDDYRSMARLIGDAAVGSNNVNRLKAWWIYQMIFTPDPLGERLTLLWHNHFATSNAKVDDVAMMRTQNEKLRSNARGPFGELLTAAVKDPAMLKWLDADANRKGSPNENLGREIMELFTLGVGNYTEEDVKDAARALTGWTVKNREFKFDAEHHDGQQKTILGRTGKWNGEHLLQLLLNNQAMRRRLAFRICEQLMGENFAKKSNDAALQELASEMIGNRLTIQLAVETVIRSEAFFAQTNIGDRILSPVELVVGNIRALELFEPPASTLLLADHASKMGQNLFNPPNVFGWPGGRSWLNSRTLVSRANFAGAIVKGQTHNPAKPFDEKALAARHDRGDEPIKFLSELLLGRAEHPFKDVTTLLASPQAQLG